MPQNESVDVGRAFERERGREAFDTPSNFVTEEDILIYRGLLWALPMGISFWASVAAALWMH